MVEVREFDLQWEGRRCRIEQLSSKRARQVARRLANVVGAGLRKAGGEAEVIAAVGGVLEELSDETLDWLHETFAEKTRIERQPGSEDWANPNEFADFVFGGGPGLARWFRWLQFCVEMSCGDFFGELRGSAMALGGTQSPNPSPITSPNPGFFTGSPLRGNTPTRSTQ